MERKIKSDFEHEKRRQKWWKKIENVLKYFFIMIKSVWKWKSIPKRKSIWKGKVFEEEKYSKMESIWDPKWVLLKNIFFSLIYV